MTREIKFRAWDLELDEMLHWEESDVSKVDGWEIAMILADDTFNVMQFTGLLDKNGKEIYEGDVVRTEYFEGEQRDSKGRVKREEGWYVSRRKPVVIIWRAAKHTTGYNLGPIPKGKTRREIIGNIYENPELLK